MDKKILLIRFHVQIAKLANCGWDSNAKTQWSETKAVCVWMNQFSPVRTGLNASAGFCFPFVCGRQMMMLMAMAIRVISGPKRARNKGHCVTRERGAEVKKRPGFYVSGIFQTCDFQCPHKRHSCKSHSHISAYCLFVWRELLLFISISFYIIVCYC